MVAAAEVAAHIPAAAEVLAAGGVATLTVDTLVAGVVLSADQVPLVLVSTVLVLMADKLAGQAARWTLTVSRQTVRLAAVVVDASFPDHRQVLTMTQQPEALAAAVLQLVETVAEMKAVLAVAVGALLVAQNIAPEAAEAERST